MNISGRGSLSSLIETGWLIKKWKETEAIIGKYIVSDPESVHNFEQAYASLITLIYCIWNNIAAYVFIK